MMKFAVKSAFLFVISLFIFSLATRNVSAATVVNTANPNGWSLYKTNTGIADYITGPANDPNSARLGVGSARLASGADGNSVTILHTNAYTGAGLDTVSSTSMGFSSYSVGGSAQFPKLSIFVSTPTFGVDRINFVPEFQPNEVPDQWQAWNGLTGEWRSTAWNGTDEFEFAGGTLSQYLAFIQTLQPGFVVNVIDAPQTPDGLGAIRFQNGSSPTVFDGNVDNFTINGTTYDFEPDAAPPVATNNYSSRQFFSDNNFANPVGAPTGGFANPQRNSWGLGSPAPGVPIDNFSARWEGTFDFETATYRFLASTNKVADTMRIYVDGVLQVDKTPADPIVVDGKLLSMTAGVHTVKVEYVHTTAGAVANFSFWKSTQCYDLNADGTVNSGDMGVLAKFYGPYASFVDMNGDNVTNSGDQLALATKFGKTCPYI